LSMTSYDAVLFSDLVRRRPAQPSEGLTSRARSARKSPPRRSPRSHGLVARAQDVDLLPSRVDAEMVGRLWADQLPPLVGPSVYMRRLQQPPPTAAARPSGSVHLVGSADWSSPINAGVLLLVPSRQLYHDGIAVLETSFDPERGWNATGSPVELLGNQTLRRLDGSVLLHQGAPARVDDRAWTFAGADIDQGFLVYMLLARHSVARFANSQRQCRQRQCLHLADHYWARAK